MENYLLSASISVFLFSARGIGRNIDRTIKLDETFCVSILRRHTLVLYDTDDNDDDDEDENDEGEGPGVCTSACIVASETADNSYRGISEFFRDGSYA